MRTFIKKPTGRPKSLSPEIELAICNDAKSDPYFRYIDLARRYNTTDGTIRNTLRRFGIPPPKRYGLYAFPTTRFWKIRNTAQKRGLDFDLTMPYLDDLYATQDGKCVYTGWVLSFSSSTNTYEGTASLDRIDSSKGYVKGNVQWVHKHINLMKLAHSHEEFIELCKAVARYSGSTDPNEVVVERLLIKPGFCTKKWRKNKEINATTQTVLSQGRVQDDDI